MPRPRRRRWVGRKPDFDFFKPLGVPMRELEEVILAVEEYEAIRLADLEGMAQSRAAEHMGVSQPTFNRILSSARKKLSDAIINGKAIKVEGGHYALTARRDE